MATPQNEVNQENAEQKSLAKTQEEGKSEQSTPTTTEDKSTVSIPVTPPDKTADTTSKDQTQQMGAQLMQTMLKVTNKLTTVENKLDTLLKDGDK